MTQTILLGIIGIIAVLLFAFICSFFTEIKNGIMSRMNKTLDSYKDREGWRVLSNTVNWKGALILVNH